MRDSEPTEGAENSVFDEEFIGRLRVRLVQYASSRGIVGRAEDVAQETLLVLWAKYSHLNKEADLVPLAFSICGRKIFEALRLQARVNSEVPESAALSDPAPDPHERLLNEENQRRFRAGIQALSPRCRELIRLRLLGRSAGEIADAMHMRLGTLYVWKHRCLKALTRGNP